MCSARMENNFPNCKTNSIIGYNGFTQFHMTTGEQVVHFKENLGQVGNLTGGCMLLYKLLVEMHAFEFCRKDRIA